MSQCFNIGSEPPKPFYVGVQVTKALGGKKPLWHARKSGVVSASGFSQLCGAGNTAENAIRDLQRQSNR